MVHLGDSSVTRAELEAALQDVEIDGLRQVIVIDRDGRVGHAFSRHRKRTRPMPMEGKLYLDTTTSPEEVKAHLHRTMPFEDEPDVNTSKCLISQTTYVMIGRRSDPVTLEIYRDQFGIGVKLRVYFQRYDDERTEGVVDWVTESVQATLSLLRRFAGDAVLMLYTDLPVLLRKDGSLRLLYTEGDIWDDRSPTNLLPLVDLPYTVEPADPYR